MSLGYTRSVRAVMLEVPEELLEERRRKGFDRRDEVWAGVLHMVPPAASTGHNRLERDLLVALIKVASIRGFEVLSETAVFDPAEGLRDYRIPDLVVADPDLISNRGVEGTAAIVIEVLSPGDESREKLPFYARVGVREVWLVDPGTRAIEVLALRGDALVPVKPRNGVLRSAVLAVELGTIDGKLRLRDGVQVYDI